MNFKIKNATFENEKADICVFVYEKSKLIEDSFKNSPLKDSITALKKSNELSDTDERFTTLHLFDKKGAQRLLFVSSGKKTLTLDLLRQKAGHIAQRLKRLNFSTITVDLRSVKTFSIEDACTAFTEGFILGQYSFSDLKTATVKTTSLKNITYLTNSKSLKPHLDTAVINANAQNTARHLANLPGNLLTPELFVKKIQTFLNHKSLSLTVYDVKAIQKKGMHALYNVGKGSAHPPYLVEVKYNYSKTKNPAIIVGKGITFDAGGISLKPSKGMGEMKADMSGAAAVVGTLKALAEQNAKCSVIGLIPLAENMPSGTAYRPGDVIESYSGKSIEITNTDAEGRLILADSLSYATEFNPSVIVDIATLTGAACVALGELAAALFGNDQTLVSEFLTYEKKTGEQFWQLPLFEGYLNYLKSDSADLINASESRFSGGAITAAKFLEQFVADHRWLHLDIAPMMKSTKASSYMGKGMTGFSTRTLIQFLKDQK